MADNITVAIDGMGGDRAPEIVVEGIEAARRNYPDVRFLLFGDSEKIKPLLDAHPAAAAVTEIRHTLESVSNDAKPTTALRSGKNTSMRLAIDSVSNGEAAAVVSAGNTGALMAMATIVLRTVPGIDRPAIATCLPTVRGLCVMLDLGANVECSAANLVQFAVMGEVFARNELNLAQPSIGILNIGVEGLKGNDSVKEASAILQESELPIEFHGFIEGDDIALGTVDVVVTDGFTGNVALKVAEGTVKLFATSLRETLTRSLLTKLIALMMKPALGRLRDRFDPRKYNGAMLVGLNGIVVKSHGGTDGLGFANAIGVAINLVTRDFNARIKEDMGYLMSDTESETPEAITVQ